MRITLPLAALAALAACTPATIVMTAQQAYQMCQADYETAVAIAERLDHITNRDGPALVREVCGPDDPALETDDPAQTGA